jgi:hypothetical protein
MQLYFDSPIDNSIFDCTFVKPNTMYNTKNNNTMKAIIEKINYFGNETNSDDYNAKVLYRDTKGNLFLAHIYVCFFSKEIYISKHQPKEAKAKPFLQKLLNQQVTSFFNI